MVPLPADESELQRPLEAHPEAPDAPDHLAKKGNDEIRRAKLILSQKAY